MSKRIALATVLHGLALLASCTSEAKPTTTPPTTPPANPTPAHESKTETPAADVATFTIEGNDLMQYNVKQIEVKVGQRVRITLKNVGNMPKAAMGHNLIVLRKGVTIEQFTAKVMAPHGTPENEYLPAEAKKDAICFTKQLGPGESDSVEFTAPGLPAELFYMCTFPGHFAVMNGKIIVK